MVQRRLRRVEEDQSVQGRNLAVIHVPEIRPDKKRQAHRQGGGNRHLQGRSLGVMVTRCCHSRRSRVERYGSDIVVLQGMRFFLDSTDECVEARKRGGR
jgi:hypothetical protein